MITLREYQKNSNDSVALKYTEGLRRILVQLPTGAGKTVTFSALIQRFLAKMTGNIVIAVHRDKLLKQTRKTLYKLANIEAEAIVAGVKKRNPNYRVYVTMIETANKRLATNPRFFGDVGLLIIDECHLGNFRKIFPNIPENTLIVGYSATPLSSTKKDPLRNYYQDIITGPQIKYFIGGGSLCQNLTYHIKGMDRSSLKVDNNGEFQSKDMGEKYSKPKHIQNVIKAYEDKAKNEKTIVFNCNVEHSKKVCEAFIAAGYDARHFDGTFSDLERDKIYNWFENTDGAILCNVDLTTAGFDEPSLTCVIINYSTTSLNRWLQSTGRGSRPCAEINKTTFKIIDLGGNAINHGDWSDDRDWHSMFFNPPKPSKGDGTAPVKVCVNESCEMIIPASASICHSCQTEQPSRVKYDPETFELELLTKGIDIIAVNSAAKERSFDPHYALHVVKSRLITNLSKQKKGQQINDSDAYRLLNIYQESVKEWCKENDKRYGSWYKEKTGKWLFSELEKHFDWKPQKLEINL